MVDVRAGHRPTTKQHTRGNLPPARATAAFIGRDELIGQLVEHATKARLVTLTGVGGVGKTRLAVQAARTMASAHPDGAWLVDLTPHSADDLVAAAIATTLGLHDHSENTVQDTLIEFLRSKSALLILDNCEHVLVGAADAVVSLLSAAPDVRIMATSRQPLGIEAEQVLIVPPLAVPPTQLPRPLMPVDQMPWESVRMLVSALRAKGQQAFAATAAPELVVQLSQRLEGIPLGGVLKAT